MAKTLCKLAKNLPGNLPKYIAKINEAKYVCKKCGRAANSEDSLCKAEGIK